MKEGLAFAGFHEPRKPPTFLPTYKVRISIDSLQNQTCSLPVASESIYRAHFLRGRAFHLLNRAQFINLTVVLRSLQRCEDRPIGDPKLYNGVSHSNCFTRFIFHRAGRSQLGKINSLPTASRVVICC